MRREREQRTYHGFQTGTSLLLVVFVVISMVLFGILGLSGAVGDIHYSTRSLQKTKDYYTALSVSEHKLAELDVALRTDGILPEGVSAVEAADGSISYYYYEVPLNKSQVLHVEIEPCDPAVYGQYFLVRSCAERNIEKYAGDPLGGTDPLPLMRFGEEGGNMP